MGLQPLQVQEIEHSMLSCTDNFAPVQLAVSRHTLPYASHLNLQVSKLALFAAQSKKGSRLLLTVLQTSLQGGIKALAEADACLSEVQCLTVRL